jgi:hypothetical protein
MNLDDLAQQREKLFLERYGEPNYHLLDLPKEAKQEAVDFKNYVVGEMRLRWPDGEVSGRDATPYSYLSQALNHIASAYYYLERYEQLPDPPEWAEMLAQGWGEDPHQAPGGEG